MTPLFSIAHTTARPNGWQSSYWDWMHKCVNPSQVEYILCVDKRWGFDTNPDAYVPKSTHGPDKVVWNTKRKRSVDGWNIAAAASTGKIIILNSDDVFPCEGWDKKLKHSISGHDFKIPLPLDLLEEEFVIETTSNTPADDKGLMVVQIMSRARYQRLGYAMYPEYESMYADNDFSEHARKDGVVIDAKHIVIEHRHPIVTGQSFDKQYAYENQASSYEIGEKILKRRRREGFNTNVKRLELVMSGAY